MKKSTIRQRNYRLRKELELWIAYYLREIRLTDLTLLPILKKNLIELEKVVKEYVALSKNKGETK